MIDPKTAKGHNALSMLVEFYGQCLAEAEQKIAALEALIAERDKAIARLQEVK